MKTTHILLPCYLSLKLSHSEQKNNINPDNVETPLSWSFGYGGHRCPRKISLYSTKLRVIICRNIRSLRTLDKWLWDDSHSFQHLSTLESRRFHGNTKQEYYNLRNLQNLNSSKKVFWIPSSPKLGYSTNKLLFNNILLKKTIINKLWVGW